ncbi:MAG: thiamine pyrophosphate-binding protein [Bacteroidota bacterium]|nr:thiamine pyrophosphate-binding protein [Bacteroidota bacterium]
MAKKAENKITAEVIVDFFVKHGISHVFDLSGGMIAFIEDAISMRPGIQCFPMHHEQAAGFAAEGYSRSRGNFGVAIATSGPGATNLMTAIGSSYFDSIPAMFIVGQVHTDNIKKNKFVRQEGFQETDIVSIVKPITKYAIAVRDATDVLYELEKAHFIMKSGRPGAVVLDIPINIQRTEVDMGTIKHFFDSKEHTKLLKQFTRPKKFFETKVKKLQSLLLKAKAPVVIVGNGIRLSDTTSELQGFVHNNNLPVITSLLGVDAYPANEHLVGFIGSNGNRHANIAFANADLIIALGTRLDIRQTGDPKFFNSEADLVHVDVDKHSINYAIPSTLSFEMDLKDFFIISKELRTPEKPEWITFIREISKRFCRPLIYSNTTLDPNTFIHELSCATNSKTMTTVDVGQNQMWCAQSWKVKEGQRILFSGGMGAMGFSLPAAIGAWCATPALHHMVICGDGGLQINIQELETMDRNNIPLKLFIINNKSLGMVREFQDLYFRGNYQSTITGYGYPDLRKLADTYNLGYVRIEGVIKDDPVIKKIIDGNTPTLIEVMVDIKAPLQPKVVYGHKLDDQQPYLGGEDKKWLELLKAKLKS